MRSYKGRSTLILEEANHREVTPRFLWAVLLCIKDLIQITLVATKLHYQYLLELSPNLALFSPSFKLVLHRSRQMLPVSKVQRSIASCVMSSVVQMRHLHLFYKKGMKFSLIF